ncbi:hypothetical protein Tco_0564561 [Tanacetum coccineum]
MPWRHSDTDLHDDFPTHFNEDDVARLSEFQVPLCPPPRHSLYMCGLTTACRHPDLQYHIKDRDKNVISMDTFLKLPTWTGTIVSKGDPLPEDQRPKPRVTPSLLVEAKRAGTGVTKGPKKKRRVQENTEPPQSGSEGTLSATYLNQAIPGAIPNPATVISKVSSHVEKEVVDLSGNTRVSSPPVIDAQPSPRQERHDTHEVHSQSSYRGSEDEPVGNQYVPNWGLRNDLRVCTFRACKELVSHLATPTEDEFLSALSNMEVISRAYQTLGQSVVAQGELLKRHEQLNHDYVDLRNRNDVHLLELDHLRSSVRRTKQENEGLGKRERDEWRLTTSNQVEQIRTLEKDLEPKTCQLETAEERIRVLEDEKRALSTELARAEIDHQRLVREFIPTVARRLHTSVEYRQTLAASVSLCYTVGWLGGISLGRSEEDIAGLLAGTRDLDIEGSKSWEAKHRELFTTQDPYVQKVANSYILPMADLLRVSPDVPAPRPASEVPGSTREQVNDTDPKSPPPTHETTDDTPFGTTT